MIEDKDFGHIIGQTLSLARVRENELWLVFDEDMIIVGFPDIRCNCVGCEEKKIGERIHVGD